jgi:hypothetical protein
VPKEKSYLSAYPSVPLIWVIREHAIRYKAIVGIDGEIQPTKWHLHLHLGHLADAFIQSDLQ